VVKRQPQTQPNEVDQSQHENLFHTLCKVLENTYSLIVDSCSCCNYCSCRLNALTKGPLFQKVKT